MKNKKTLIAVAAAFAATAAAALVGCNPTPAEKPEEKLPDGIAPLPEVTSTDTFLGATSESSYTSESAAVDALFAEEFVPTTVQFVSYEKKAELPVSMATTLSIPEATKVKKITVVDITYKDAQAQAAPAQSVLTSAAADASAQTYQAYIIEYNDGSFKFFSPRPTTGAPLTLSYYKSLKQSSVFDNASSVMKSSFEFNNMSVDGYPYVKYVNEYNVMVNNKTIKSAQTKNDGYRKNENGEWEKVVDSDMTLEHVEYYTVRNGYFYKGTSLYRIDSQDGYEDYYWTLDTSKQFFDEGHYAYPSDVNSYNKASSYAEGALSVLFADMLIPDNLCTMMEKTETGFKFSQKYINDLLRLEAATIGDINPDDYTAKFDYSFTVVDGKIMSCNCDSDLTEKATNYVRKSSITVEIKDVGTTAAVKIPETAALDAQAAADKAAMAASRAADASAFAAAFDYSMVPNYEVGCDYGVYKACTLSRAGDKYVLRTEYDEPYICDKIYIFKQNGKWYKLPVAQQNATPEETTEPTAFDDFADIKDQFDKFKEGIRTTSDVSAVSYCAVIGNYCYTIDIENGKVVSALKHNINPDKDNDQTYARVWNVGKVTISDNGDVKIQHDA